MQNFDIRNPSSWTQLGAGEVVEFGTPEESKRQVRITMNTNERVDLYVSDREDMAGAVLVASCSGMFEAGWSVTGTSYMEVRSPSANAAIFMASRTRSQVLPPPVEASYTTVEPMSRRNSEYDRMVYIMRLNERRREDTLQRELAAIRAEREAMPVKAEPKPEPMIEADTGEDSEPKAE